MHQCFHELKRIRLEIDTVFWGGRYSVCFFNQQPIDILILELLLECAEKRLVELTIE